MMLLAKVCQETGAKVCLSTNWRLHDDLRNRLYTELAAYGCECVGSTPNANEAALQVGMRPLEIRAWVERWNEIAGRPPVGMFVAVDDRALLGEEGGDWLRGRFVQTNFTTGLTERVASRLIAVLHPLKTDGGDGCKSPDSVLDQDVIGGADELPRFHATRASGLRVVGRPAPSPSPSRYTATAPPRFHHGTPASRRAQPFPTRTLATSRASPTTVGRMRPTTVPARPPCPPTAPSSLYLRHDMAAPGARRPHPTTSLQAPTRLPPLAHFR